MSCLLNNLLFCQLKAHSEERGLKTSFEEKARGAHSEPDQGVFSKEKWACKRRQMRPKHRSEFTRGLICSWKPLNQDSNSIDKHQILGNETALNTKPLKVYSRIKAKKTPINVGERVEWITDGKGIFFFFDKKQ